MTLHFITIETITANFIIRSNYFISFYAKLNLDNIFYKLIDGLYFSR